MTYDRLLLHIPHSSSEFPIDENYLDNEEAQFTLDNLTDWYTEELFDFQHNKVDKVVFPYSRLFCDVERYNDDREPMLNQGMGVFYTHGLNGKRFRKEVTSTIEMVEDAYNTHHDKMREILSNNDSDRTLLVDCHSFIPKRFKNDGVQGEVSDDILNVIDISLGYNNNHNSVMVDKMGKLFEELGYTVSLNTIYKGSMDYGYDNCDSIMIEVNKRLYIDEFGKKNTDFYKIKASIDYILKQFI